MREAFADDVQNLQMGGQPDRASPFEGSRANNIMKLSMPCRGDAYRLIYAAKFRHAVYVLHAIKKKSKSGIRTPQRDLEA